MNELIAGCKKGENDSFAKLIDLYTPRLYGYFLRLTTNTDTAEELLSRLFVKMVKIINSYEGGNFDAWLFKVASNVFYDHLRAKKHDKAIIESAQNQLLSTPDQSQQVNPGTKNEIFDQLQLNLKKLDPDTTELIVSRYYSQLSFKEIAQKRGEPIGTTLSKVHRGLKKLRELMEK